MFLAKHTLGHSYRMHNIITFEFKQIQQSICILIEYDYKTIIILQYYYIPNFNNCQVFFKKK